VSDPCREGASAALAVRIERLSDRCRGVSASRDRAHDHFKIAS
jgi:hypothetical protein